jgi:hypothetical protein
VPELEPAAKPCAFREKITTFVSPNILIVVIMGKKPVSNEYYQKQLSLFAKMTNQSADKQASFFQSLLIAAVSLLAILIALHAGQSDSLLLRLLFALALLTLVLGILSVVIVLHDFAMLKERNRQEFRKEALAAMEVERKLKAAVSVQRRKIALRCEKIAYISLLLSLLFLTVYAVVSLFS